MQAEILSPRPDFQDDGGRHKNEQKGGGRSRPRRRQQVGWNTSASTSVTHGRSSSRHRAESRGRSTSRGRPSSRPARNVSVGRKRGARSDTPGSQPQAKPTGAGKQTSSGRLPPGMDKTSSKVSCAERPPLPPTHTHNTLCKTTKYRHSKRKIIVLKRVW